VLPLLKKRSKHLSLQQPNTNEFVEKMCKMEGATAGFALLLEWPQSIQLWLLLQSGDHIVSSSSVLGNPFIVCELFSQVEYRNHLF
jgi:O-succinylhomoserine sulfhydrylase